jgi:protein-disulfide isomerase/uncharacterized membrane protein
VVASNGIAEARVNTDAVDSESNEGSAQLRTPLARVPRPWIRWIGVVLAALGWWHSYDLYQLSAGFAPTSPLLQRFCGTPQDGPAGDCGSVLASEYGRMPLTKNPGALAIPVSALGMGYFAFVGFWYLVIGCPTRSRWLWHFVLVAVVAVGCLQSVQYTRIMRDVLHQWCAGCLIVHIINAGLGVATLAAFPWRRERESYEPHPRGRLVMAVFAAGAFLFVLHGAKAVIDVIASYAARYRTEYKTLADDPEYVLWDYQRGPVVAIDNDPSSWIGPTDAPHELVVFLDYQCTACLEAHKAIDAAIERHPAALRVAFRNYPLDRSCNPHIEVGKHSHACAAAVAAEAARELGGAAAFKSMKQLLYERQSQLGVADLAAWAGEIGLDPLRFSEMLVSDAVSERIERDIEAAHATGVTTTPALLLDNRKLTHWARIETWDALLAGPTSIPAVE